MSTIFNRPYVSRGFFSVTALLVAATLGCQPASEPKKPAIQPTPTKRMTKEPVKEVEVPVKEVKEQKDTPSVGGPVEGVGPAATKTPAVDEKIEPVKKKLPLKETTEPAKKPADAAKATDAANARPATASGKIGNNGAVDPSMDPTVKWLPKASENAAAGAKDEKGMKAYSEKINDVTFDMVPVPGGTFKMGSPDDEKGRNADEGPQVDVKISPFWMEKCEVTWDEYLQWAGKLDKERRAARKVAPTEWDKAADALTMPTPAYADMTFGMGKEGYPAVCMTQFAAKMYCKWLSAKTGRYYRLPTEAEWEYACRAGSKSAYSFGDDPKKLGDYAWTTDNSDEKYHKIGKKKPNAWGLYDMHGNVAEWCLDEYAADRYKTLSNGRVVENPLLGVTKSYPQVARGGAWTDEASLLRSAARRASNKDWKMQDPQMPQSVWYFTDAPFVGFRVIRPLQVPTAAEAAKYEITDFEKQEYRDCRKAQADKQ